MIFITLGAVVWARLPLSFGLLLLPLALIFLLSMNHPPSRRAGWIGTVGAKLADQQQSGCQPALSGDNDRHRRLDCQLVYAGFARDRSG